MEVMEVKKQPIKPKLTSKAYKQYKLNMTQHGFNTDFFDGMTRFYSEEERESHRVIANGDGKCTDVFLGQVVNFGPISKQCEMKGNTPDLTKSKFVWVMDDSGNLYVDFHDGISGYFHSSMMGRFRPIGAGEIYIVQGFICMLNEDSGHYAPQGRLALVIEILTEQGFKFPKFTQYDSKHTNQVTRVDKKAVKDKLVKNEQVKSGLNKEGFNL